MTQQVINPGDCPLSGSITLQPAGHMNSSCNLNLKITAGGAGWTTSGQPMACNPSGLSPYNCTVNTPANQLSVMAIPYPTPLSLVPVGTLPTTIYYSTTTTVTYRVTNNTPYTLTGISLISSGGTPPYTPAGVTQSPTTGVGICAQQPNFNLSAGQSCNLILNITSGNAGWTAIGGPQICATNPPSDSYCGVPAGANQLNITAIVFPSPYFSLVPNGTLPTSVYNGQTTSAQYTVTNLTPYTVSSIVLSTSSPDPTPAGVTIQWSNMGDCGYHPPHPSLWALRIRQSKL